MSDAPAIKDFLCAQGYLLVGEFCRLNDLPLPAIRRYEDGRRWSFNACAYYRAHWITICLPRCAAPGYGGRAWSWPGYISDRTPYGVVAHECGHHADLLRGVQKDKYWSEFSTSLRGASGEARLTSYCPNNAEWFAEMFRLFLTNPDLLRLIRPRTHRELLAAGFKPAHERDWKSAMLNCLPEAPERTLKMAERRIEEARVLA